MFSATDIVPGSDDGLKRSNFQGATRSEKLGNLLEMCSAIELRDRPYLLCRNTGKATAESSAQVLLIIYTSVCIVT
jgi:hypothetical protein